jgi:RecJ-like exonuclease
MSEKCEHEPEAISAFWTSCKHCGCELDHIPCKTCDGAGAVNGVLHSTQDCNRCKGTGVKKWVEVKP